MAARWIWWTTKEQAVEQARLLAIMRFTINTDLLAQARSSVMLEQTVLGCWRRGLRENHHLRILVHKMRLPLYDMDAHIYGTYHGRFTRQLHPANTAWATAQDGLAWLLAMSWEEFDGLTRQHCLSTWISFVKT